MTTRANSSRERILASSERLILNKGFASTSIEDILDKAAITKSGFFYHFKGKADLARALVERYMDADDVLFTELFVQADNLSEDPLHRLLIFLKLLAKKMSDLEETHPGCLVASFTYESQLFDEHLHGLMREGMDRWRTMIAGRLETIMQARGTEPDVSVQALANMFTATMEGGIILSRAYDDNCLLVDQILAYRNYLRLLFE